MYRSRMPYTRWHAKEELLKERMKQSLSPKYYKLRSNVSSSETSSPSETDKLSCPSDEETTSVIPSDVIADQQQCPKSPVKAIRQQQKEWQRAHTLLGFGIQSPRFRPVAQHRVPPPGTYDLKTPPVKKLPRSEEPFTKAPQSNRQLAPQSHSLGPGIYEPQIILNKSTVVDSKGRFDTGSDIRCGPIKTGYLATMLKLGSGPRFTQFPSNLDLLNDRHNAYKGKFLRCDRNIRKCFDRIFLTNPTAKPPDPKYQLSPCTYHPLRPYEIHHKFNVKLPPFMKLAARMTRREYDQYIGNVTPFTGPGRYNYPREGEGYERGTTFPKQNYDSEEARRCQPMMRQRSEPKNIPNNWPAKPLIKDREDKVMTGPYLKLR
ncbi:unnamed protein product [Calicophoron daubneyi]|uniref:Uncharacterized protein n=1 Tax=Calicophoron daubneyi TaxID=300641 RepID=A0AAV2T4J8_CALDB